MCSGWDVEVLFMMVKNWYIWVCVVGCFIFEDGEVICLIGVF